MPQQRPDVPSPPAPPPPPDLVSVQIDAQAAAQAATEAVQAAAAQVGAPAMPAVLMKVPTTAREMRALRAFRSELSNQLTSASGRRRELVQQLERTDGPHEGIRDRIELLDRRILRLESEIDRTGQLAAAGEVNLAGKATTTEPVDRIIFGGRGGSGPNYTAIGIIFTLGVLMPMAIAMARLLWRRATAPRPQSRVSTEDSQRLVRLEQAVDTIAVEVERISEGQRFVAQLMSDNVSASRMLDRVPVAGGAER